MTTETLCCGVSHFVFILKLLQLSFPPQLGQSLLLWSHVTVM